MSVLRVGGLTPLTTLDFPGELAAVVYCQGCPFACPYCHNGDLVPVRGEADIPWQGILDFLGERRGLLDAVVFSGGEPTLQAALPGALAAVRAMGFKTGLHTAGPYPSRLARTLPLLDWVGLDIKALPEDYPEVTGVPGSGERAWESLRVLLRSGVAHEVRTTPMPGWPPARVEAIARRLRRLGVNEHRVQTCRTARMLDPARAAA